MSDLLQMSHGFPELHVAAGDVVIEEGSMSHRLLFLVSGRVTVERAGTPFARIDMPGAVFGELAWILGKPATATVRASTDIVARVVSDPQSFFTDHPDAALLVLRTTASRLDGVTQYLVDVKRQFAGLSGHLGMVDQILDTLVHHQGPPPRPGSVRDPEDH